MRNDKTGKMVNARSDADNGAVPSVSGCGYTENEE